MMGYDGLDDLDPFEPAPLADRQRRALDASRLEEPLKTLYLRQPVRVPRRASLRVALERMREAGVGSCLIEDEDGRLAGIFTERDLLNKLPLDADDLAGMPVERLMQPDPETLTLDDPIALALNRMGAGGYRNIPIVDRAGRALALVTLRDIVHEVCEHFGDRVLTLPTQRTADDANRREGA